MDRSKFSNEALAQIAECEREEDRWLILRSGVLFALGVPIIVLGFGWLLGDSSQRKKRNAVTDRPNPLNSARQSGVDCCCAAHTSVCHHVR